MGTRTLLDQFDAAVVSGGAKLWSELLSALALAGQGAVGARCFLPDPPGADASASRRPDAETTRRLPDDLQ